MEQKGKAWLIALFMGIVLPGLLFSVAEKMVSRKADTNQISTQNSNVTEIPTEQVGQSDLLIPILQSDGSVKNLNMQEYLVGVLLGEMPADFDVEALKAQAVVARTYALKRNTTGQKHINGAVCKVASCCQSYYEVSDYLAAGGSQESIDKVREAINSTQGQVLTYHGALIEATYFSCSGGRTEAALAVWGTDVPYLQAVDSPGEENATYYTDNITISAKEFTVRLGISPKGSPASWLGPITYTSGGGVDTMVIAGKTFQGTALRQRLGLRSTIFTIMAVGNNLVIQTHGFGHRVGMSQYGAEAMAVGGSTYDQILMHYYPGTVLDSNFQN